MLTRELGLLVAVGGGLGLLRAAALARAIESMLYGVRPWDPVTYAVASVMLVSVCALYAVVPACRAMRIDRALVLRHE
jgi:putative ABC transport system permease protein